MIMSVDNFAKQLKEGTKKSHSAAENTSLINPLKNPVIPKAVNNKRDSQSIKTKSSVIGNYLR